MMAISPTNFRFWILRPSSESALSLSKGQTLDCRLSESETRVEEMTFTHHPPNRKSKIENLAKDI
jgi:hypothetical protein